MIVVIPVIRRTSQIGIKEYFVVQNVILLNLNMWKVGDG